MVPDTGDIDILSLIPLTMENYYHQKDNSRLLVELERNKAMITRERKSHGPKIETYDILVQDNRIFVGVRDIINRIERSIVDNTQRKIRLKVDPILPEPRFKR